MAELTTTSYAILGLLALRDHTTYELTKQMQRTVGYIWPRAERKLYDEPKRLVAAGYAEAVQDLVGRRRRTTYSITPAGREALARWLGTEPAPPAMEFEGMLRVLFADQGDIDQLRRSLRAIAADAAARRAHFAGMAGGILETGGEYPHRAHVNALGMQFMTAYLDQMTAWSEWALKQIEEWDDTTSPAQTWATQAREIFTTAANPPDAATSDDGTERSTR
ncbi:PadR family transcriptional regulator [Actinomadura madurae]|uniref:PadR family transcriptional regulator n=1 Tax=Actinomadura madurae TaxID=1993 RepID=UPI000D922D87|nr:PadR family transcriptional regulator [Actinomadura madurae]SPT51014.1 Transcriptional regulator PadR-like family [Actinomadura madurae]